MEKYYALVNDYRNENNNLYYTKVLCVSNNIDALKVKMNEEFASSKEDANNCFDCDDLEISQGKKSCSISLEFRYDEFHDEYTIHEVELGII